MHKPFITVLTATYNREGTLIRLFNSLQNQTNFDFEWVLINDGSTDNTNDICKKFVSKNFGIRYFKQENIGLNMTLNMGIRLAEGELIFRVDSDDFVAPDAIEQIINVKYKIMNNNKLCALVFLSKYEDGKLVGYHPFDCDFVTNFFDYRYKFYGKGDRAEVVKRSVYLNYPFVKFGDEKFCTELVMWAKMADDYDALYVNKAIYIREYSVDSISASGVKLNIKYPIGATERFKSILTRTKSCKYFIENSIQYFRWIQKTNISNILAIKGVPIHATLIGLIPGLFLHLIDILAPFLIAYLRGKINKAIKQ